MTGKFKKLFERGVEASDPEPLGEDMAPSPLTLAERTALCSSNDEMATVKPDSGPFSSAAHAPIRDFTN